jgi:hypothetical protein
MGKQETPSPGAHMGRRGDPQGVRDRIVVRGGDVVIVGGGRGVWSCGGEIRREPLVIGVAPGEGHWRPQRAYEHRRTSGERTGGLVLSEGPVHIASHSAPKLTCALLGHGAVVVGGRGDCPVATGGEVGGRGRGEGGREVHGREIQAGGPKFVGWR